MYPYDLFITCNSHKHTSISYSISYVFHEKTFDQQCFECSYNNIFQISMLVPEKSLLHSLMVSVCDDLDVLIMNFWLITSF